MPILIDSLRGGQLGKTDGPDEGKYILYGPSFIIEGLFLLLPSLLLLLVVYYLVAAPHSSCH